MPSVLSLLGKVIRKLSDHLCKIVILTILHSSSGLAQHAVVLGSGGSVDPDTHLLSQPDQFGDSTIQQSLTQGSGKSQPSRMTPRATAIKEQGFSDPVAAQIEAPQRRSTRAVYEAKWATFVRRFETSQVDKEIADFLLLLFQEKNL